MNYTMRPIFRGTTIIQINKENPQIVDFKEIFAVNMVDMDYYQTQYKILESRTLAKRVIQSLKLPEHPEFMPKPLTAFQEWKSNLLDSILTLISYKNPSSDKDLSENEKETHLINRCLGKETSLINQFLNKLKIEPIRNSRLVKIHFESNDPELSAQVANSLASTY